MWIKQAFLGLLGAAAGFTVAGGLFAFIIALGVVSRFAGKTHTGRHVLLYEDAVALGGILGNLVSIYAFPIPFGTAGLVLYGLFTGIFVGAWSMALTEIVDIIPIFSRRIRLKKGLAFVILGMALGRSLGAVLYYYQRW